MSKQILKLLATLACLSFTITAQAAPPVFPSSVGVGLSPNADYIELYYNLGEAITPVPFPAATGGSGTRVYSMVGREVALGFNFDPVTSTVANSPKDNFITRWRTTSNGEIIIFPRVGTYTIDWGDGTFPEEVTNTASHTTNNARTPTIRASNTIAAFSTGSDTTNAVKLSPIKQGGTVRRTTMKSAFDLNGDIGGWGVSNIINIISIFL